MGAPTTLEGAVKIRRVARERLFSRGCARAVAASADRRLADAEWHLVGGVGSLLLGPLRTLSAQFAGRSL
jgi:hypothetical protein